MVAAPALIPRKPGERIKTDRRDAVSLARLDRAGELTAVWVPGRDQEAMRDLSRAREDMKTVDRQLRQRLSGFLLRHQRTYTGKQPWTQAYWRWLESQRFETPQQQIVLEEYVEAVRQAQRRTALLESQLQRAVEGWSLGEAAQALTALRGVDQTAAATLLAELDDISRFDHPRQLMSYVGLVPSESSSGAQRRQGGLTKTGNSHAPADLGRVRLGLPFSSPQDGADSAPSRTRFGGGASHRLGRAAALVRQVSAARGARPQRLESCCCGRP